MKTIGKAKSSIFQIRSDFGISKSKLPKLKSPTPINVIIWAMEVLGGGRTGVAVRDLRNLIKRHFILPCRKEHYDKRIDDALVAAMSFGVIILRENMYYSKNK